MSVPSSSSLRNRLISKQLDVGKQQNDATSGSAAHPTEAVESPLNSFAQSPSSADRLRERQSPLDELVSGDGVDIEAGLIESGNSSGSIDGSYGPKTLEALNLFQQDQVDALKLQTHSSLSNANRGGQDTSLLRHAKTGASSADVLKQELTSLASPNTKSIDKTEKTEIKS